MPEPTLSQRWAELKERLRLLMDAYGPVALGVWFTLFAAVLGGLYVAIRQGAELAFSEQPAAGVGALGAAYLATQATKPARILATLVLTPLVARALGRSPRPVEATQPATE